jgi:hypothetical protein
VTHGRTKLGQHCQPPVRWSISGSGPSIDDGNSMRVRPVRRIPKNQ